MRAGSPPDELVVLSWNLAGRVRRLPEQVERVLGAAADLVCLQELTPNTLPRWREALVDAGYAGVQEAPTDPQSDRLRPLAVLTAAREPLRLLPVADVPWPERVLAVCAADGVEIVNVHSPISPKPDMAKVRTHEAVHRHLAADVDRPRILCGDLNTPRRELDDGQLWTFARDRWGRLRPDRGERWDRAELALLRGLEPYGIRDAFRARHGHARRELSWKWPRWDGGYRLDHLLASREFDVVEIGYLHAWRTDGLSDHSPLVARLERIRPAD
ncbi:MAG TPA: endonuclease/exonuclease/phosphatase family protein [Solirubrobacteraceae bacterium]|jgi:exonuclease III|nr:endonuclease/exonuclease/phosphatase family protein [Solirubrobacteraceae bacterium]